MPKPENHPPRMERYITDYRLQYVNPQYPLLSFMYAVLAGGEAALYCDHTGAFVKAYLTDHFPDADKRPAHIKRFFSLLAEFDRLTEPDKVTGKRTRQVTAEAQDWTIFLECLKEELIAQPVPEAFW